MLTFKTLGDGRCRKCSIWIEGGNGMSVEWMDVNNDERTMETLGSMPYM